MARGLVVAAQEVSGAPRDVAQALVEWMLALTLSSTDIFHLSWRIHHH